MKIYIAAPLFNEIEIQRNVDFARLIENEGIKTYLPQRDGGLFYDLKDLNLTVDEIKNEIFQSDLNGIKSSDIILCLLDGRTIDEGLCIELGIGYALDKICIGYKTDFRSQDVCGINIMVDRTLSEIFSKKADLITKLNTLKKKFNSSRIDFESYYVSETDLVGRR